MEFIGVIGDPGSFKTCIITSLLAMDWKHGRNILATYTITLPGARKLTFAEICKLADMEDENGRSGLYNASIGFSELSQGASAYEFLEATPRQMGTLVSQLRHDEAIAYYDCQNKLQITAQLRRATGGYLLPVDRDKHVNPGPYHWQTCQGIADVTVLDADERPVKEMVFNGKPWYHLYNTREKLRRPMEAKA